RVAHGGEIDDRGNAGEVLHQHARRTERNLTVRGLGLEPLGEAVDVLLGDGPAVLMAQHVLQEHLEGERQAGDAAQTVLLGCRKAVMNVGFAADFQNLSAFEAVERGHGLSLVPSVGCMSPARGMMLPQTATCHRPPATPSDVSESSPEAAYKVFFCALPYLRHRIGTPLQNDA